MSLVRTARWAASVGSRLAMDMAIWTLTKVEKMGEGHLCSRLYTDVKDASTMDSIFNDIELSELPKDHIHHDNSTV
tara:strand:- start:85 stop:312 length:228 start_codon:yes stop_codon:yes gene_type:complete